MARGVNIPWVGGRYTMGRGRYTMSKGVDILWEGDQYYMGRGSIYYG